MGTGGVLWESAPEVAFGMVLFVCSIQSYIIGENTWIFGTLLPATGKDSSVLWPESDEFDGETVSGLETM
jgi:hypothetical protein